MTGQVPFPLAAAFTAFLAVLVPYYWIAYSPWNFLYYCDIALFLTAATLWTGHPLPASVAAVGILVPQMLWIMDFLAGGRLVHMADYMYNPAIPLLVRILSSFHGWLPLLLLWLMRRLGYDPRGFMVMTVLSCVVLAVGYFLAPAPPAPPERPNLAVNINYVHGLGYERPQTWMPPLAWLGMLIVGIPVLVYYPTHLALKYYFPLPPSG